MRAVTQLDGDPVRGLDHVADLRAEPHGALGNRRAQQRQQFTTQDTARPRLDPPERVLVDGEQQATAPIAVLTSPERGAEPLQAFSQPEGTEGHHGVAGQVDPEPCVERLVATFEDHGRDTVPTQRRGGCQPGNAAAGDEDAIGRLTHPRPRLG